jgi:iron complex transport system ATP-binding protein
VLVDGLSMSIGAGQLWCIVGPNGVGKSTLMGVLAGLRAPDGGAVEVDGVAATQVARPRWRASGPTCRRPCTTRSRWLVEDAVRIGRHPHLSGWGWGQRDDDRIVRDVIDALDLEPLAARDVLTLSGGERQRVSLAAVLAQQAPLLLLDEPVAHLDLRHQIMVLDLLRA